MEQVWLEDHETCRLTGVIRQTTGVKFDVTDGELVPSWESEILHDWDAESVRCKDHDVEITEGF